MQNFNTTGDKAGIDPEVRKLLEYLEHKSVASELTKELDEAVDSAMENFYVDLSGVCRGLDSDGGQMERK